MRAWFALSVLAACGGERLEPATEPPYVPPPERCEVTALGGFAACNVGSGIFGEWQIDELGLPSYFYGLDQHRDMRAAYPWSEPGERRDHWAAFGNRRINAMVSNDGIIEVVTQDRGVEYLNAHAPEQQNHAGGFGYVDDGESVWSTAYRDRPFGARTVRRFGMGYAEASIEHRDIRVRRVTAAPPGDAPWLVSDVTIENRAGEPKQLSHYEVWDVGRRSIEINWIVAGDFAQSARATRDARNGLFDERVVYQDGILGVRRNQLAEAPAREEASAVDHYPPEPFLVRLRGPVDAVYVDQASFFGAGGVRAPAAIVERMPGHGAHDGEVAPARSALGQPHVLVMRSDLWLEPGEATTLRFAYGYARYGEPFAIGEVHDDVRAAYVDALRPHLFDFVAPRYPELTRELAWHSYQAQASVGWRDYWQTHVVPQGSAYLYLHGADGAARDLGIFAVPLVYLDRELAKQELALYMGIQRATDGGFAYAFQGHGMIDDAGIHTAPSDLPLFFCWALGEYLGATGDLAWLDASMPFYPQTQATVWDHLVAALRHQFDVVRTGEHGLIRVQTGDWSDGIVVEAPDRELAVEKGESVPNTQMAAAVLPRIAELVEARDAALAAEIRARVEGYREALSAQWNGAFFYRAYYGDGVPVGADAVNLEAQVWALIGDTFAASEDRAELVAEIGRELDDPSPVGATLTPGGQVWPAISGLLSWGYARSDPQRAWAHLARNTMTAHARAFPDVWYGIWSGPDGFSAASGHAWASAVTPMTDFPVQNNNLHLMPVLAALRVAGVEATAQGLRVAPPLAGESYALRAELVELSLTSARLDVVYRPIAPRTLEVEAPPGAAFARVTVDGTPLVLTAGTRSVSVPAPGETRVEAELVAW